MEAMAAAPKEPPRGACSGGAGRLNRIAKDVGDGCSKNTQRLRWSAQLLRGAVMVVVGRRRRRSRGGAVQATKRWPGASEVCGMVGAVRQRCEGRWERCGTVAQSCAGHQKRAVRCGAGDEMLAWSVEGVRDGGSCASEVCWTVGVVRDGGADRRRR